MEKNIKQTAVYIIITVVLTFGISLSSDSLFAAWRNPDALPPNNNMAGPIYNNGLPVSPVVDSSLGITGNLTVGGMLMINYSQIKGLAEPIDPNDIARKEYVDTHANGCSEYIVHRADCTFGETAVYCNADEQFVQGGCSTDFPSTEDWPVLSGRPVLSAEVNPEDARPGWACTYETRRDGTTGTDDWYGMYCSDPFVMCCK